MDFPSPSQPNWLDVLRRAEPDCVVWIHERDLQEELLQECREGLHATCGSLAGECSLAGGESLKTWEQIDRLLKHFRDWGVTRTSVVVTTGGGAMSDAVGFAAAIWKRGVRLIHIPTTPLAAVDAAWGGKTGINWGGSKNQLGTFAPPLAVHVDARWMHTLPSREFHAGLAEVAKHALLDKTAFAACSDNLPPWPPSAQGHLAWTQFLKQSAQVKQNVVQEDPEERGVRCILNLGHTVAHAIEAFTASSTEPWLHGEAVAVGLHFALFEMSRLALSERPEGAQAEVQAARMVQWLHEYVPVPNIWPFGAHDLWAHMVHDKKNVANEVRDVAWRGVGEVVWPVHWKKEAFEATWNAFVRSWNNAHSDDSN